MSIKCYHNMKDEGDYSFKTTSLDDNSPIIGFELEVDHGDDREGCADELECIFDDLFCYEHDGSLDDGFEIISQPISEDWAMSNLDMFETLVSTCKDYGFKSHDSGTCGLHMHMDKAFFGKHLDSAIAKMLCIFDKHWESLLRFSRRNYDQVDDWCNRYCLAYDGIPGIIKEAKCRGLGRYHALNLTNRDTIEVRLWRGTLRYETFLATLKLTYRLMYICRDMRAVDVYRMSWEDILGDDPDILEYWETVKNRSI